jgi:AAA domain (dynein-related subfamily)
VQCTAETDQNQIRYGWNYAQLLAKGPSREALVPTPLMRAMEQGRIVRFEELTRMPSDVEFEFPTGTGRESSAPLPQAALFLALCEVVDSSSDTQLLRCSLFDDYANAGLSHYHDPHVL